MWRLTGVILVVLLFGAGAVCLPATISAAASPVLIVGIQTGGSSASDEKIILANATNKDVPLEGISVGYFSAQSANMLKPSRSIPLQGIIRVGETFVLATESSQADADLSFSATLAGVGGHVALLQGPAQLDLVGWGAAQHALGLPAPAPEPGKQLVRRQNGQGQYQNTSNNLQDFMVGQAGTPAMPNIAEVSRQLQLSELLPNPKAPITDSTGEYIELHNSGIEPIQLRNYVLVAGPNLGSRFVLPDEVLAEDAYKAFYITQTKLSLGNGGSRVQLQSSDGAVLSDVSYSAAVEGQAWAWDGAAWNWTGNLTPNSSNAFTSQAEPAVSTKSAVKKSQTVTKAAKKATSSSKQGKVKAAKTVTTANARLPHAAPVHNGIVAGVGGLAVLYGVYEYRRDLANFIRKLRGNRKTG